MAMANRLGIGYGYEPQNKYSLNSLLYTYMWRKGFSFYLIDVLLGRPIGQDQYGRYLLITMIIGSDEIIYNFMFT